MTPWSPLKGGVLTGKYTRANAATARPGRGGRVSGSLNERATIIGARTMEQLEDNLGSLSVHLTPEHLHALDGLRTEFWALGPQNDKERW